MLTHPALKVFMIPMFTGIKAKPRSWLSTLKKKSRIYKLTGKEMVWEAHEFFEGFMSEWIGLYREVWPEATWEEFRGKANQTIQKWWKHGWGGLCSCENEWIPDSRIFGLAKIAFTDTNQWAAIQMQLDFMDSINANLWRYD